MYNRLFEFHNPAGFLKNDSHTDNMWILPDEQHIDKTQTESLLSVYKAVKSLF